MHNSFIIELFILSLGSDKLSLLGGAYEGGMRLQQVVDEITPCIFDLLYLDIQFNNFLEIGSAGGGTAFLFNYYFQFKNIVLIDDNIYLEKIKQPKLRHKNLEGIKYTEIIGNSRSEEVVEKVKALNISFDLMIIDGDHRYSGVRRDADIYLPLLNKNGYVIFHDTVACRGVKEVFHQMKNNEEFTFINEYISETWHRPCGIGVFQKRR